MLGRKPSAYGPDTLLSYQEGLSPERSKGSPGSLVLSLCSHLLFVVRKSAPALTVFSCSWKTWSGHIKQLFRAFCLLIIDQSKHSQPLLFQVKTSSSGSVVFHSDTYLVVVLDPPCSIFFFLFPLSLTFACGSCAIKPESRQSCLFDPCLHLIIGLWLLLRK